MYETTDRRALTGPETLCTPSRARPKVLLDTNAVRYLFGRDGFSADDLNRVRDRLQQRASVDDVRIVLTTPIGWELAQFRFDPNVGLDRCCEMLRFIFTVGFRWVLKIEYERMRLELVQRRKLRDAEVFDTCDIETTIANFTNDEARIRDMREMLRSEKAKEREGEAGKRESTVEGLRKAFGENWVEVVSNHNWEQLVKSFVKTEMRQFAKKYDLKIVGNKWPKPRDAPTFWYSESFYAAKIFRVFFESKKELTSKKSLGDIPDMIDATHFRDTAYVDCLVTQDRIFAEVGRAARVPLTIMSFDDFARSVLANW